MRLRKIYYKLPIKLRYVVRRLYYLPIDIWTGIFSAKQELIPPKGKIFIGSGDFYKQGQNHLEYLKKYTNITPSSKVLDVGFGIGRTAVALTSFLDKNGVYYGFDVVASGVDWCKKNITKKFSNFTFDLVDVNNDLYHSSQNSAESIRFDYKNNFFDVVFLFSVFTHMELTEIEHYLKEIYNVMKPNSYCLATFFLYDSDSEVMNNKDFQFPFKYTNYRLMDAKVKGANIAIKQEYLLDVIGQIGFENKKLIKGYWSMTHSKDENDFQDILILRK